MLMEAAVRKSGGNLVKAAELLGVTRRQIAYRLEKEDKKQGQVDCYLQICKKLIYINYKFVNNPILENLVVFPERRPTKPCVY